MAHRIEYRDILCSIHHFPHSHIVPSLGSTFTHALNTGREVAEVTCWLWQTVQVQVAATGEPVTDSGK